jgi:hypothetical protein
MYFLSLQVFIKLDIQDRLSRYKKRGILKSVQAHEVPQLLSK